MWGERLITAPEGRAVSLDEVKRFLRIDSEESDLDLVRLISVATDRCQGLTRRQFLTAKRQVSLPGFPCGRQLFLPWAPLQRVHSVRYTLDGTTTTLAATAYDVVTDIDPGLVCLKENTLWPDTDVAYGAVQVEYSCGYGDTWESVPEGLRHAVLMTVGMLYEWRSDLTRQPVSVIPVGAQQLLDQFTVGDEFTRYDFSRG